MNELIKLNELTSEHKQRFIAAMRNSRQLHYPFTTAPQNEEEFDSYLQRYQSDNHQSYVAENANKDIIGVFNISEIVRGVFHSGYLGYYANVDFAAKGLMSQALKLVLNEIFTTLKLHRIEANIQPTNTASIALVSRNGFLKEGFSPRYLKINGMWCDHFRFALTYEDWLASYSA